MQINIKYSLLLLLLAITSFVAVAQTSVQNFGTSTAVLTSQTASTTNIPNPTSGTTYARAGAVAPNAPVKILSTKNPLGTDSYLRATASSSTSVCKVSPWVGYTSSTEFYTSFKTMFADSSGGNNDSSGVWSFYQGAGAMYSNNNDLTNSQVFCGLRFTLSVGGNISLSYMAGTSWISTGLVTSTFASSTFYKIEIFGNNKTSGTISYTHNGVAQSVAVQKFDLYINGVKVGDDLAEGALPANNSINAATFIGISSTNNVANIFLDDVITYNAIPTTVTNVPYSPLITSIIPQNNRLKINFTAGGNGGSAITNYNYSLDSGITWQAFSPAVTASPFTITGLANGTAYNIRIKAVNANGEGDISNVMNAIPNCVTTYSTTNTSICYNQLPYTWNGTIYQTYGIYIQTLVNVALCDSIATLNLTSSSTNTSVSITSSVSTVNLCSTTSITFTATPTNGGASPTYTWKKNGTTVGTNSTTYTNATWANNDTVRCMMTSNATCPLPATTWSNNIFINLDNPTANTWQQKADMGSSQSNGALSRSSSIGFSIGNKGYMGTGGTVTNYFNDFWEYDPVLNAWTQKANFGGTARSGAIGFSIGSKGYVGLGVDGTLKNDFWEFDPNSNTWTQKADFSGIARSFAIGFSIGSKGYVGTGYDGTGYKNDFWEYNPSTNAWTQQANFGGSARWLAVGFSIGSKGYIATGYDGSSKNDFWEYNPLTNIWTQQANFGGSARHYAIGFSIGAKAYLGTGYDVTRKNDFWEYDPSTNQWVQKSSFAGSPRNNAVGFSIAGKGYIGLGFDGSNKSDFWEYSPTNTRITTGSVTGSYCPGASVSVPYTIGCTAFTAGNIFTAQLSDSSGTFVNPINIGTVTSTGSGTITATMPAVVDAGTKYRIRVIGSNPVTYGTYNGTDLTINAPIYTSVSIASSGTTANLCSTNSLTFTATPTNGGLTPTYTWKKNGATVGTNSTTYTNATWANNDSVQCLMTSNTTCPLPVTTWSNKIFINLDNPIADNWQQKADFGFTQANGLSNRNGAAVFNIGNKGYVGTGYDGASKNDFWEYDPTTNVWTQKANFGGMARQFSASFSIGNKGYLGTGYNGSVSMNDFWEYDPSTNIWTQKANFGGASRNFAVGFSVGNKGYVGTGNNSTNYFNDFWEYDPATNLWTQKANFGGTARASTVGFSIENKGYVGTGYDGAYKNDFWEYDPATNGWTQKADFGGVARQGAVGFSIGNKGFVGTGYDGSSKNDFWQYDPAANLWTQKANIGGTARGYAVGFSIGSKGYVGTGYDGVIKNDFWEYDPATNAWMQKGGNTRNGSIGFNIGNKGYIGTGYDGASKNDFWEYDPVTNVWTQKANFGGIARQFSASFSIGNKGYVGTGFNGSVFMNDFWEYDPVRNLWTQKANFGGASRYISVGFSIGNKGYVGTGYDGAYKNDFWEYDPATNVLSQKANFGGTARYGAVGFSIGNKGFVGTGYDGAYKNDFWEYDPATNVWIQKANFGGTARYGAVGFSIGNKGFVGTGTDGTNKNDFWEYNPATNTWTQKANFGSTARYFGVGFSIGNKGYLGTGYNGVRFNDFWEYSPTNTRITTGSVTGSYCPGSSVSVPYTIGCTAFTAGNIFTAQLSDSSGTFANPVNIGTVTATGSGTITATMPAVVDAGTKYRIRVIGSNPVTYGTDNGTDFTINAPINTSVSIASSGTTANLCSTNSLTFTATPTNGGLTPTYIWKKNGTTVGTNSAIYTNATWANNDSVQCLMTSNATCPLPATTWSNKIFINLDNPTANTWQQKTDVGFTQAIGGSNANSRRGAISFNIGAKAYMGTGYNSVLNIRMNDFWEYDPTSNVWTQKANFSGTARGDAVGFSVGAKGYLGMGSNSTYFNDFWEYDPATNLWTQKANFGGVGRERAIGFSIGSKGYVGTGRDAIGNKNDFWEYDPITNLWTQKANFGGTARFGAVGFSIGNKGYLGTGYDGALKNDFWEYDPASNSWIQKANFGGTARYIATGFNIGEKGYLGTGTNGSSYENDFWEYDPASNSWTQKTNFNGRGRFGASGFNIGSKGYISFGDVGNYQTYDTWEYDAVANSWTQKANLGETRHFAVGFNIGSKGYVGNGNTLENFDFWEYDPMTNAWTQKANFGSSVRSGAIGFSIGNKGYVGTGTDGTNKNDFWEYDPILNIWSQKSNFGGTARFYAVGFSIGNKGYIGTGYDGVRKNDFWEYNPATNEWTQRANFGGTARYGAVGFSIGNKGYVGTGDDGVYKNDFWEYDPTTNAWTQKSNFGGTARYGAVGFSIGNKGYLGTGSDGGRKNDFWEYDPATNLWLQKANFGGTARSNSVGFSIGNKGYLGTGLDVATSKSDFWEYSPTNTRITTGSVTGSYCPGSSVSVPYTIGCTAFTAGNIFTAQLSDSSGTFVNPINIGTVTATGSGTITATMPAVVDSGTKYRIRVIGSNPVTYGTDNGTDLTINAPIYTSVSIASSGTTANLCSTNSLTFNATPTNGGSSPVYTWKKNGVTVGTNSATYTNDSWANNDSVQCLMTSNATCPLPATTWSNKIFINLDNPIANSWQQKADFGFTQANVPNYKRSAAVAFSIGNKGYMGTGNDGSTNKNDFWEYNTSTNIWTQKADFAGSARDYAIGFSIGSKGYLGTGNDGAYKNDFWEYDPSTNIWTQKASIGSTGRYGAIGFCIGSKGYVGLGYVDQNGFKNDFWEYDPTTNLWTQKANFSGEGRMCAVGFSIGTKGYIGTGAKYGVTFNDFWEYNPLVNLWTQRANFGGVARVFAVGFGIGSKGYLGSGDNNNFNTFNDFWQYDPLVNTWIQKANLGIIADRNSFSFSTSSNGYIGGGLNNDNFCQYDTLLNTWKQKASKGGLIREGAASFSIRNKGYVGIGRNATGFKNDFWEYDPALNTWTQKADFGGTSRAFATGFSIGSKGYIGTGTDAAGYKNDFWEYDPGTNLWSQKANFGGTARTSAVGFNIGNKGYVGTGYDGTKKNDFWEYNPETNVWTQQASFAGVSRYGAVGFSIGNKGYLGLGNNDGIGYRNDFWEFNPVLSVWIQKANFSGTARWQAVGFSIGSKGYIGTGYDAAGYKNDFWEYDPISNEWSQKANFGGTARSLAVGFSIGNKGYLGTAPNNADFWEYSPTNTRITTGSISGAICRGSSVSIPYSIGCTAFNLGNIFTAQLSDSSGTFGNPVNIGTLTATGSGTITGLIPANTLGGSKYRIRVVGSLPETYGLISENDFTILVQSISTTNVTKCSNELPYSWNGNSYSAAGTYSVTLTNSVGCDSVANLILTVKNTSSSSTLVSICPSQLPYNWNGNNYSNAGTFSVTLTNFVGCDSVANLVLTVNNTSSSSTPVTICSNQLPYSWNGNSYNTAGIYSVTLTNLVGCDSIATLVLTVNNTPRSSINSVTICSNQLPYSWNGNSYNSAGTYSVSLTNSVGCDSVANLLLTVINTSSSSTSVSICSGQLPYSWNGNSYSVAGTYSVVLTNTAGCDSIATLLLSTSQSTSNTTAISACDSYYWSVSGQTYTSSGSYTSVTECSTQILNLIINISTSNTTTTSSCGSYTWSLNGQTYTSSGTYSYISGCSTENLVLTIIPFVNNISTVSACDNYLWNVNGQTYTQSGSYTVAVSGATVNGSGGGVRISQLYPGGGGTTGTYLRDYIELYNSSCSPINISGWSLAYGSAAGNFASSSSTSFTFPAGTTIPSKKYLLIECGASGTAGSSLPVTPDFSTTTSILSMSATSGKVALLNTTISNLACASLVASTVVDKLSWGTGNCPEGTAKTAPTTSQVLVRNNGGETDTDNNSNDFTNSSTSIVTPRNAASTANSSSPCVAACTNEVLNLTITTSTSNTTSVSACESYTWTANGQTYTSSGSYTSVSGCTSRFLNLTITSRPEMPTLACYQTATFITSSCSWVVTGTQPTMPTLACYETATFNTSSCAWVVTGTQPAVPTGLACYQTSSFNTTTCDWVVTGTQPAMPTLACYQTATFNTGTCSWDVTGSQPSLPTLVCYQTASFNITTCAWVVTGTQPAMPTLACYQTANFNTSTCSWDVTGTAPSVIVTTTSACNTYTWSVNSNAYTQSGTYNYNTNCQDYTLNLTIKQPTTSTTTATASGSYTWNGNTYNNSGTYTYHTTNAAGCDSTATLSLTINAIVINNITNVCNYIGTNQTLTYTASVSGASSYVWILPPNTQLVSGQGTRSIVIKLLNGFASQANKQLRVTPAGGSLQIIYLAAQGPVTPATITASTNNICSSIGTNVPIIFKIPKVYESGTANATATSYLWSAQNGTTNITHPNGTGANDTIVAVTFNANFSSSTITVQSVNACGVSGIRSYLISRSNPSVGIISGPTNSCEYTGATGTVASYSVAAAANINSYTWNLPTGVINVSGQGMNTISFKYPSGYNGGSISVIGTNGCGTSSSRTLSISRLLPGTPSNIDVINTQVCPNREYSYSLASLPGNATSLLWTVPSVGTIASGQGTRSINVSYPDGVVDGAVTVKAISNCGTSGIKSITIKLSPCPASPSPQYTKGVMITNPLSMEVKVFPNPTASSFKLQVIDKVNVSQINVRVLDVQGRLMKTFRLNPNESITFGSDFKPGVYMLEVNKDGEKKVVRVVKY